VTVNLFRATVTSVRLDAVAGNRGDAGGFGFRGKLQRLFDRLSL
jgi:hypothetical protein